MVKRIAFACLTIAAFMFLSSCASTGALMPQATNMVKAVSFEELNLTGKDYVILDRIEASARIEVSISANSCTIKDPDGKFEIVYVKDKTGKLVPQKYNGVLRTGYLLSTVYNGHGYDSPDEIAHRLAIYRIINLVKEQGGDGIIEPVISTNVEGSKTVLGVTTITYFTTVSGKVVRLNTSK